MILMIMIKIIKKRMPKKILTWFCCCKTKKNNKEDDSNNNVIKLNLNESKQNESGISTSNPNKKLNQFI